MIRPMTKDCYDLLMMDLPLRMTMVVDFGVDTPEHYSALQRAVRAGATAEELDKALGKGKLLTALVKYHTGIDIEFETTYDKLDAVGFDQ
ncbi:MAG: hypothetical protein DRP09_21055 [Candidatus Thorarchaeota archaeon]|nr:MAG: hypothetical protein DRP09_21055 [Candidatus Thorarchaeota archaeon]